ncbi:general stress protein [Sporosarcina gallistercoris]|uniref:general stress protein n=1 Tax=Sporosarcina gallistercoris TaxID=2762245 RepID=UPI003D268359
MEEGKRFIGMFHTEPELLAKVVELKAEGYVDHQIFVIAKSENDVKMLQSRTEAEIQTTHESWLDKFMDFMTGEDRVRSMMDNLGFSEDEKAGFYQDVNNGSMLLYVDESSDMPGQHQEAGTHFGIGENVGDPNLGANTWVEPPGGGVTRTPEQPAFGDTIPRYTEDKVTPVNERPIERSEFSAAADDSITNGLETTDFAGDLGRDPEQEQRRQVFQDEVNEGSRIGEELEKESLTTRKEHRENRPVHDGFPKDPLDKRGF